MIAQLSSLIPTPLHPAVVHLPIALAVLVPLFAIGALIAIARGAKPLASWGITTALVAALAMSSYVALETGEDQEEKVEAVVPEAAFESHEESAEQFFQLSLIVLGISALGFLPRAAGTGARIVATAGTLALIVAGYQVGHSGGEMVYKYGAASAYVDPTTANTAMTVERAVGDTVPPAARTDDDH
jgi:uncharacterized membrane protein